MKIISRSGWGRTSTTNSACYEVSELARTASKLPGASGLPIGLGRSYGDTGINSEGVYWSTDFEKDLKIDVAERVAHCGAGVTIGELERAAGALGLFPPVVPGTEFVTIGGAIASDIHGKSHVSYGSIGNHISEVLLLDSFGRTITLSPDGDSSDKFWATVGGLGLTGIIVSATLRLIPIETSYVTVIEKRVHSLKEMLKILAELDEKYLYTVAWIGLSKKYGCRGIVSAANHSKIGELSARQKKRHLSFGRPLKIRLPDLFPSFIINSLTTKIFNTFWFRKPLKSGVHPLRSFLHPLDSIGNWNYIYGKNGFVQYQVQIPFRYEQYLFELIDELNNLGVPSFLGVLKKFGGSTKSFLSFPAPGWTLALDFPTGNKMLLEKLSHFDEKLSKLGGRVYLSKDSRLARECFQEMYPDYPKWLAIKRELDPTHYWQSDQARRLGLI